MKTIGHPLFIFLFSVYILYYALKQTTLAMPVFVTNYLADLLSIVVVNTILLFVIRRIKKMPAYELPTAMVVASVILFGLYFEFYLPTKSSVYVRDYADILCYSISGIFYVLWRKQFYLCAAKS